jgi:hypothetical protein
MKRCGAPASDDSCIVMLWKAGALLLTLVLSQPGAIGVRAAKVTASNLQFMAVPSLVRHWSPRSIPQIYFTHADSNLIAARQWPVSCALPEMCEDVR